MNNAYSVIFRTAYNCQRSTPWLSSTCIPLRPFGCRSIQGNARTRNHSSYLLEIRERHRSRSGSQPLSQLQTNTLATSAVLNAVRRRSRDTENGLPFRETPLPVRELQDVFGTAVPPSLFANRLLRILHGRRVDGTLDLPLPTEMQTTLRRYPHATDSALFWLRANYDVDEDAAIIARIEREETNGEHEDPNTLLQRGQNAGLYGPQSGKYSPNQIYEPESRPEAGDYQGPQSGHYQAKLSQKGDVFGQSELERIRADNEAKAALEEEELEKQISRITEKEMHKKSQDTSLASRPEQSLEAAEDTIRPPNEFDKWVLRSKNKSTSQLTLDSPEIKDRSAASRLLPSLLLMVASGCGLYYFVQSWQPPKRSERLWPNMSLSFATICGIFTTNLVVFVLWKFPPAWSMLNRYFLMVPATIKPLSLVGSIFSHNTSSHLLINAIPLLVFGPSLHEELGRAQFLTCYLMSGIFGNYVSLLYSVGTRVWITSSLGASGSVWGIMAAYCCLHSNDEFTVVFIPQEWKDTIHIKGWMFFVGLLGVDLFNVFVRNIRNINYWAHFGGAAAGWLFAEVWKGQAKSVGSDGYRPKPSRPWWEFIYKGAGNPGKGS